jgi:hypothetical protein
MCADRRNAIEIGIWLLKPLVQRQRIWKNRLQATLDGEHMRYSLDLIVRQVGSLTICFPAVDCRFVGGEKARALIPVQPPRIRNAEEGSQCGRDL